MNIMIGLGDIGGQRALFSPLRKLLSAHHKVYVLNHRLDSQDFEEFRSQVEIISPGIDEMRAFIQKNPVDVYLFSTSVIDKFAVERAEWMRHHCGVPTICILDNWMNYKGRLELKGQYHFPTIYCVMDEVAKNEAIKAGIASETIRMIGINGLKEIDLAVATKAEVDTSKKILLFINEPAASDQGVDLSNPKFRGYTEYEVMRSLFVRHQHALAHYKIIICPHPRDDQKKIKEYLEGLESSLDISLMPPVNSLQLLPRASGVIGMASIFLFYSWLYGVPTLAYQPHLRLPDLTTLKGREGLHFVTDDQKLEASLKHFLGEAEHFQFNIDRKRKIFYDYISPPHDILEILGNI